MRNISGAEGGVESAGLENDVPRNNNRLHFAAHSVAAYIMCDGESLAWRAARCSWLVAGCACMETASALSILPVTVTDVGSTVRLHGRTATLDDASAGPRSQLTCRSVPLLQLTTDWSAGKPSAL